jgi:hypothetical protein
MSSGDPTHESESDESADQGEAEPSSEELVKEAEAREAWRASPERRRLFSVAMAGVGLCVVVGVTAALIATATDTYDGKEALFGLAAGGATAYVLAYAFVYYRLQQRRAWRDRRLLDEARADLVRAEASLPSDMDASLDFQSLWTVTQKRLDYYHRIATSQAERSFLFGQLAAGVGFTVILGCAVAAAFARSSTAAIVVALLGATGGGLAGYIGSTFMRSQETAAAQLRAYFLQPLQFSKVLAGERLLEQMTDDASRTVAATILIRSLADVTEPSDQTAGTGSNV